GEPSVSVFGVEDEAAKVSVAIVDEHRHLAGERLTPFAALVVVAGELAGPVSAERGRDGARIPADSLQAALDELDIPHEHRIPRVRVRPTVAPWLQDRKRRFLSRTHGRAGRHRNRHLEGANDIALPDGEVLSSPVPGVCLGLDRKYFAGYLGVPFE